MDPQKEVSITVPANADPEVVAISFCVAALQMVHNVETRARIAWYINERFGARIETDK